MPCHVVHLPGGVYAIVKTAAARSRTCTVCKRLTRDAKLCDFPVNSKTCDRVLCPSCAHHVEPDKDYCPEHARQVKPDGGLKL